MADSKPAKAMMPQLAYPHKQLVSKAKLGQQEEHGAWITPGDCSTVKKRTSRESALVEEALGRSRCYKWSVCIDCQGLEENL